MRKSFLYLVVLVFAVFTACSGNENKNAAVSEKENVAKTEKSEVPVGLAVGNRAPELEYPSPDGEMIALSDLRGKMVLIDFWAGWCPPCRMENPNLVRTYQKYKDEDFKNGDGFTIYSVSLDQTKENWVKAINDDNLMWEYHVSDLKYWQSEPAAMYQVRSIPSNFLINGDGVIVAKNLRGEALGNTLNTLTE